MKGDRFVYGNEDVISVSDIVAASYRGEILNVTLRGEQGSRLYYGEVGKKLWKQIREADKTVEDFVY